MHPRTYLVPLAGWFIMIMASALFAARPASPPKVREDPQVSRRQTTEARREKALEALAQIEGCCDGPRMPAHQKACRELFPRIRREMEAATWAHQCGNYDEAMRLYAWVGVQAREMGRIRGLAEGAMHRCRQSIQAAIATLKKWSEKAARLKDPGSRQAIDAAIVAADRDLRSLEASCVSSNPASVVGAIGPKLRTVDLLFRRAR